MHTTLFQGCAAFATPKKSRVCDASAPLHKGWSQAVATQRFPTLPPLVLGMGQTGSTSSNGGQTTELSVACSVCNKSALVFESFVASGPIHEIATTQVAEMCAFLAETTDGVKCQWCLNKERGEEVKEARALEKETKRNEALIRKESLKGMRLENERQRSLLKKRERVSAVVGEDGEGVRRSASGRTVSFHPDVMVHPNPSMTSIQPEPAQLSRGDPSHYQVAPAAAAAGVSPSPAPVDDRAVQLYSPTPTPSRVPTISGPFAASPPAQNTPAPANVSRSVSMSPPIPVQTARTPPTAQLPPNMIQDPSYQIPAPPPETFAGPGSYSPQTQYPPAQSNPTGAPQNNPQPAGPSNGGSAAAYYNAPLEDTTPQQSNSQYFPPAAQPPTPAPTTVSMPESPLERLRRQNEEAAQRVADLRRQRSQQERDWAEQRKIQRQLAKREEEARQHEQEIERRETLRRNVPPPRDTSNPSPPKKEKER